MKVLLILLSGLKWGKLATSGGSMLLSLLVYATIWGWRYAAGFIALLFAHEMGHYVAARYYHVDATLPFFLPAPTLIGTFGAFIRIRSAILSDGLSAEFTLDGLGRSAVA